MFKIKWVFTYPLFFWMACWTAYGAEKSAKASVLGDNALQINDLKIPIIQKRIVIGYFLTSLTLQAQDEVGFKKLKNLTPLLCDAFFGDLYGAFGDLWIPDHDPKIETIRNRLQRILDGYMGENGAKVYINIFYVQRL